MKTLRERRLLRPVPVTERNPDNVFTMPFDTRRNEDGKKVPAMSIRHSVLLWINENTVGDFYIGSQLLYFVEDIDAMTYILYNMQEKVDNNEL